MDRRVTCQVFEELVRKIPDLAVLAPSSPLTPSQRLYFEALLPLFFDIILSVQTQSHERILLVQNYGKRFASISSARLREVQRIVSSVTLAPSPSLLAFSQGFLRMHVRADSVNALRELSCPEDVMLRFQMLTALVPQGFEVLYPPGSFTPCVAPFSYFVPSIHAQIIAETGGTPGEDPLFSQKVPSFLAIMTNQANRYRKTDDMSKSLLLDAWQQAPLVEGLSMGEAVSPTGAFQCQSQPPSVYIACHPLMAIGPNTFKGQLGVDVDWAKELYANMASTARAEMVSQLSRCLNLTQFGPHPCRASVLAFNVSVAGNEICPCAAIAPSGRWMAVGAPDHSIRVWALSSNAVVDGSTELSSISIRGARPLVFRDLVAHSSPVLSLAFSPDGKFLVSGGIDGVLHLWSVQCATLIASARIMHAIWKVAFAPGGGSYAAATDSGLYIFGFAQSSPIRVFPAYGSVTSLAWHPSGLAIAAAGDDTVIRVYSLLCGEPTDPRDPSVIVDSHRSYAPSVVFTGHEVAPTTMSFSPDGTMLASADSDGVLIFHDCLPLSGPQCKQDIFSFLHRDAASMTVPAQAFDDIPCNTTTRPVPAFASERTVPMMARFDAHQARRGGMPGVTQLAWSQNGEACASVGPNGVVNIWDTGLIRAATTPTAVFKKLNERRVERGFAPINVPHEHSYSARIQELKSALQSHAGNSLRITPDMRPDIIPELAQEQSALMDSWLTLGSPVVAACFGWTNILYIATVNQPN